MNAIIICFLCAEVIPVFSDDLEKVLKITVINCVAAVNSNSTAAALPIKKKTELSHWWVLFTTVLVPTFLMLALAVSFAGVGSVLRKQPSSKMLYSVSGIVDIIDPVDMWVAGISWGWTNLFIRRRLNPEIGESAYER